MLARAFVVLLLAAIPLALIGGGASILVAQETGERAEATVRDCETRRFLRRTEIRCTGTWWHGGRVVRGTIQGADDGDVGKRIDIRLSGGRAYTTSRVLPILLIAMGLAFGLLVGYAMLKGRRRGG